MCTGGAGRGIRYLGIRDSVSDPVLRNRAGGDTIPAGDSLLFVAGALSALPTNDLNVHLMVALMIVAAIVGDAVNYTIGRLFGEKLFSNPNSKIFRRSYG